MTDNWSGTQFLREIDPVWHFKQSILSGKHWYIAFLETAGLWSQAEEVYQEQTYRYLINGEAFDLLLLAERLCAEAGNLIPEEEQVDLLFFATPPIELSKNEIKELLGEAKYQAFLNYHYGVIIEEALILAVEEEVHKQQRSNALYLEATVHREAYQRVYGADKPTLLHQFRSEMGYPDDQVTTLTEQKEFTYWLFKYRIKQSERARVASDTKKALQYLQQQWASRKKGKRPGKAAAEHL